MDSYVGKILKLMAQPLRFFLVCIGLFLVWPMLVLLASQLHPLGAKLASIRDVWIWFPAIFIFFPIDHWKESLRKRFNQIPLSFFVFGTFLLGSLLLSSPALSPKILSIRQFINPIMLWLFSRWVLRMEDDVELKNFFYGMGWWLMALGIVLYLFPIWNWLDIGPFVQAKNLKLNDEGVIEFMYEPILGGMPRMSSVLLDPINLGHFWMILFALDWKQPRLGWWGRGLYVVAIGFTFCKGAVLQFGVAMIGWTRLLPSWAKVITISGMVLGLIAGASFHPGVQAHLEGLVNAFRTLTIFGHGLGSVGNIVGRYATATNLGIGDTFVGMVLGQLGMVGFVLWGWCMWDVFRLSKNQFLLQCLFAGQLFVSIFSETAYYATSMLILLVLMGASSEKKKP